MIIDPRKKWHFIPIHKPDLTVEVIAETEDKAKERMNEYIRDRFGLDEKHSKLHIEQFYLIEEKKEEKIKLF